jgi:hypothetical protein
MALESGSAALAWASSKPADDDGQVGQDLFPLGVEIDAVAVGSLDEFSQRFIPWMRHGTPRDGLADRGGQGTRAAPGLRQSPVPSPGVPGAGAGAPPGVISADLNQRVMYVYGADQSGSSRYLWVCSSLDRGPTAALPARSTGGTWEVYRRSVCPGPGCRRGVRVRDGVWPALPTDGGTRAHSGPGTHPGGFPGHVGPWGRRGRGAQRTQDGYTLGDIGSGTRNYLKLLDVVVTPRYGTLLETRR